jgi:hypothetical protein
MILWVWLSVHTRFESLYAIHEAELFELVIGVLRGG